MNNVVSISTTPTVDPNAPVPHFINPVDISKFTDEELEA